MSAHADRVAGHVVVYVAGLSSGGFGIFTVKPGFLVNFCYFTDYTTWNLDPGLDPLDSPRIHIYV